MVISFCRTEARANSKFAAFAASDEQTNAREPPKNLGFQRANTWPKTTAPDVYVMVRKGKELQNSCAPLSNNHFVICGLFFLGNEGAT
jgi:hypothetical protein